MDNSQDAHSKVIINGQEYDPTEAQEFIETGRKTRELEQKYNTKLDNVWPEYNKVSQERSQLQKDLADAKAELEKRATSQKGNSITNDLENADAKEAARKLGLVLNEDLGDQGFIKKDDLEKYFEERSTRDAQKAQVLAQADRYEKEIDGSDGRPKFSKKLALPYALQNGSASLLDAYEDMYSDELKVWKDQQVEAQRAKSLKTLGSEGDKSPKQPKITKDNLQASIAELI